MLVTATRLSLPGICVSKLTCQILLWQILTVIKLIYLAAEHYVMRSEVTNKRILINLRQKCLTIKGIKYAYRCKEHFIGKDLILLSHLHH